MCMTFPLMLDGPTQGGPPVRILTPNCVREPLGIRGGASTWSGCSVRIRLWPRLPHGCHCLLSFMPVCGASTVRQLIKSSSLDPILAIRALLQGGGGAGGSARQPPGPGGGGVPQHTYLKMIPITRCSF